MAYRDDRSHSWSEWLIPLALLFFIPPLGVLLIALKLFDGRRAPAQGRHPYYTQQSVPAGARTTAPVSTQAANGKKKAADPLTALGKKSKRLTVIGAVLTAIFGIAALCSLGDTFYWLFQGEFQWFLDDLFDIMPVYCFLGGGLGCLWAGSRQKKKLRRFRQYLSLIGRQQSLSISALASATGRSLDQVREDLQDMLDSGCFPAGFLDYGGDRLVLSADGLQETPKLEQKPAADTKAAEKADPDGDENAVLAEIRAVNDAIANPQLSAQIDRIGVITAKIFEYQKAHPDRSPQLRSFLSYYLPTTLKILRAYAQLEAQGIEGENITAAKQRIEGMMDKVVDGFEKQLDQLFREDALDITSDVQVLEQMLAKDGLSGDGGLQIGI